MRKYKCKECSREYREKEEARYCEEYCKRAERENEAAFDSWMASQYEKLEQQGGESP